MILFLNSATVYYEVGIAITSPIMKRQYALVYLTDMYASFQELLNNILLIFHVNQGY